MNRNEYILKLKNLKSIIDKQLLMETYNYEKWWDPKNVVEGIIKPLWDLMPKDVKKWLMVIKDIKGPGSFKIIILINTVNGDLHIKDTKNFKPYAKILASKYPKFFEILSKILHNEFKNIPKNKLLELDSVWLLSTWEKWNMNYRYKNNPRKRINYDPTNLSDPVNPLNPGNPTSPISLMNPANQPQFMSFF